MGLALLVAVGAGLFPSIKAARLEPLNKTYGTEILVSAATREAAGEGFVWREIDSVRVRGRAQEVTIFEPLGVASDAVKDKPLRSQYLVPMQYGDDAVSYLKKHPDTAAMFDEQFGKGHAKAVLQGAPYGQ